MHISQRGLNLIYEFEGKLKKLADGRYEAYRCPANVWTIYAGCTVGVKPGMVVTEEQGEQMFRAELARFERCVTLACTREPNQNQFDAFVSLAYNIGEAGFRRSSVLKYFNAGKDEKAAAAFALWNKGGGRVLRGLVRRRTAEAGLFMRPVEPPTVPDMPQQVGESLSTAEKAGAAAAGSGAIGGGILLSDPAALTSTLVAVKSNTAQLVSGVDLAMWGVPIVILVALGVFLWSTRGKA